MKLYLYNVTTKQVVLEFENVLSYTHQKVVTAECTYAPLAEGVELSATPDCAGTLRADWRRDNPTADERLEMLESLMADVLFGGDSV